LRQRDGVGYGSVWVSNTNGEAGHAQTVSQIGPATDHIVHTIRVGTPTTSVATDIAWSWSWSWS